MKRLLTLVLAAMAFVACTQNDVEELSANRADVPETLTVGFEGGDTRVELNEALKTVWSKGDEVSVFYLSDANQKWQYQGETGERLGTLKCVDRGVAEEKMQRVVVAYPYNAQYVVNTDTHNLYASLPAVQSYKEGSYGAEGNIMVAQSEFTQFSLKSVCGWLRIELTGEGQKVESITLRGNAGEQVAGLIYVDTATAEATLASEMGEASDEEQVGGVGGGLEFDAAVFTEVTLDCGSGVELDSEAKSFYIGLLPQTFESGVTIEVDCAGYKPMTLSTESSITIKRNHIVPMEAVEHDAEYKVPANQLWYTATEKVEPRDALAFNVAIVSNEWDEATGEGILTFDGELTTIGWNAFSDCYSLTNITIPDSVTTIGDSAFAVCYSLTSVTIGDSVTTIGDRAFYGCDLTSVTIPDSVTSIGDYAFHMSGLTSVTIGNSVTTIGNRAFSCCGLTSVTIPDSVTSIGDEAFYKCNSLKSVTIGDSVTTIGDYAFWECNSLTSVIIPDSVTTIGEDAFSSCDSLTSVTIGVGNGVTTIGAGAFSSCCSLTSVTIGNSVTTIGAGAFAYCEDLTSVTFGNSVTTIGGSAFSECTSLTSVTIPDSVTTIGDRAFYMSGLKSVTIGNSVTTIGEWAFYVRGDQLSVYCKATIPPTLDSEYVFYGAGFDYSGHLLLVPIESVKTYKLAYNWCAHATDIIGYNFETGEVVE